MSCECKCHHFKTMVIYFGNSIISIGHTVTLTMIIVAISATLCTMNASYITLMMLHTVMLSIVLFRDEASL